MTTKNIVIGVIIFIILGILGCCAVFVLVGASADLDKNEGEKTGEIEEVEDENDTERKSNGEDNEIESFKIGDIVEIEENSITIVGIEDPYTDPSEYNQPESGMKYVAVEIIQENISEESTSYNPYDWKLFDFDGYGYDYTYSSKEPSFSSGTLSAGSKVRGWLVFPVLVESTDFKIQFTPNWLSNDVVEIELF